MVQCGIHLRSASEYRPLVPPDCAMRIAILIASYKSTHSYIFAEPSHHQRQQANASNAELAYDITGAEKGCKAPRWCCSCTPHPHARRARATGSHVRRSYRDAQSTRTLHGCRTLDSQVSRWRRANCAGDASCICKAATASCAYDAPVDVASRLLHCMDSSCLHTPRPDFTTAPIWAAPRAQSALTARGRHEPRSHEGCTCA